MGYGLFGLGCSHTVRDRIDGHGSRRYRKQSHLAHRQGGERRARGIGLKMRDDERYFSLSGNPFAVPHPTRAFRVPKKAKKMIGIICTELSLDRFLDL